MELAGHGKERLAALLHVVVVEGDHVPVTGRTGKVLAQRIQRGGFVAVQINLVVHDPVLLIHGALRTAARAVPSRSSRPTGF